MIAMGNQPRPKQQEPIMLKISTLALAAALTIIFLAPAPAFAIDKGPCDHCTMEPIVVKGDRKKTKEKSSQVEPGAATVILSNRG
jgi:hypothetical protein